MPTNGDVPNVQNLTINAKPKPLNAFVSFPSIYTQNLILSSLTSHLSSLSIALTPSSEPTFPYLAWADYDVLDHELIQEKSSISKDKVMASSFIYRKSLIRKHYLQRTSHEYLLKHAHRQSLNSSLPDSPLADALPRGWTLDLQFADELDELLMDELYDLDELMTTPLGEEEGGGKRWFILKPGMSDKGQGIRLFSTREELEEIFVEMESDSEEEEDEEETEDDDDDDDDDESADDQEKEEGQAGESRKEVINPRADIDEGEEDEGTGIASSQLRHFVIQEYLPNPLLLASSSSPSSSPSPPPPAGRKFHIRAYTLLSSAYTFHLARTTLALFSSLPYAPPTSHEESLLPHLTNTCLQPPMSPGEVDEENVHLLWELEGCRVKGWEETKGGGVLTKEILESVWEEVGKVGAEAVRAAVECGSVHMQLLPNCFEIFGVDFLLTLPPPSSPSAFLRPQVHLLEFNASPDFHQSGERLQKEIRSMFDGVTQGFIAPFFGMHEGDVAGSAEWNGEWDAGDERWGWKCFGKGEVRRGW